MCVSIYVYIQIYWHCLIYILITVPGMFTLFLSALLVLSMQEADSPSPPPVNGRQKASQKVPFPLLSVGGE